MHEVIGARRLLAELVDCCSASAGGGACIAATRRVRGCLHASPLPKLILVWTDLADRLALARHSSWSLSVLSSMDTGCPEQFRRTRNIPTDLVGRSENCSSLTESQFELIPVIIISVSSLSIITELRFES